MTQVSSLANQNISDNEAAHTAQPTLPYMPQLDGLRALAVAAVLLYHADVAWLPGGFLGVDLFFVLSGYLITSLLLAEWQAHGSIDLARFWLRRARRLLPALFVVIAATLTFALIWLPDEVAHLRGDALAALTYSTNWYLIFKQESYFVAMGRPSLLQHLWSLAIEEQFYLLWPPLLFLLLRRTGRRGALLVALLGVACSAALMALLYDPDLDPSRVYYGTDTRALAPLLGAALACLWPQSSRTGKSRLVSTLAIDLLAFAALAGLITTWCLFDEYQPLLYGGGFVLVALLAAIVIGALAHPAASLSKQLLGNPVLSWLGTRSYAIYLWHWPIFMVTRPELDVTYVGWPLLALRFGATLLLAELSYRFVETPFRSGALARAWRGLRDAHGLRRWRLGAQWVLATILVLGATALLGVAVVEARPPAAPADEQIEAVQDTPIQSVADDETPTSERLATPTPTQVPALQTATLAPSATLNPVDEARSERPNIAPLDPSQTPTLVPTELPPAPTEVPPAPAIHIVAIGDSVMVGTAKQLRAQFGDIAIDAVVGRQAKTAIKTLQAQRDAGQLGAVVVVHIGTNGPFYARQFDEMMTILADVPRVVFVNVKVPRRWEGPNNKVIAEGVSRYPNARLADWHAASAGQPKLFARDGVHPQPAGARLFAKVIADAVNAP